MAVLVSERDREKFAYDGYLFCFAKFNSSETVKFWRCDKRALYRCKARLHTSVETNQVLKVLNEHSHGSDAAEVESSKIITNLKRRAEETLETPSILINNACQGILVAVQGKLANKDAMKKVIQRKRKKIHAAPAQPAELASIVIPEDYRLYEFMPGRFEEFLLFDSGEGDANRILIFGRQSNANWCFQMEKIYVDGTFRIAPALFQQVYVIMAERGGFVFPVLYALLPGKNEATYVRMFDAIKRMWPNLSPTSVSTDFEQAALNAIRRAFPKC